MNLGERIQRVMIILLDRYGDIEHIEMPEEFDGLDPISCMIKAFDEDYAVRTLDGWDWLKLDRNEYPIFIDMIELLAAEAAEYMGEDHGSF
jgi:hypothetical protein